MVAGSVRSLTLSPRSNGRSCECPSVTDTSPECPAGWTPASPTRRQRVTSTAAFSAGSSRTCCRRSPGGKYFIARLRGGDVAAVGSIPEALPSVATWNTYVWVDSADETAASPRSGRKRRDGAVRRHGFRAHGCLHRSRGDVLCLAGEEAQWRDDRQRTRLAELQRPQHARHRGARVLLRLGVRLGHPGPSRRELDVAGLRRPPRELQPGPPRAGGGGRGGPEGFEDVVASINPIPDDQPDTPHIGA